MNNKYRDQQVQVILYLPIGSVLYADDNTNSFHYNSSYYEDVLHDGDEEQYLLITESGTECLDCPEVEDEWENYEEGSGEDDEFNAQMEVDGAEINVKITKDRVQVQGETSDSLTEEVNDTSNTQSDGNLN